VAETAELGLRGSEQAHRLARLEQELDNMRAALNWAQERGEAALGLRLVVALGYFWRLHGHARELQRWAEALLALAPPGEPDASESGGAGLASAPTVVLPAALRAKALLGVAAGIVWQTDWRRVPPQTERAKLTHRGTPGTLSDTRAPEPLARAIMLLEESVALLREVGDAPWLATALFVFGQLATELGDERRGAALLREALACSRQVGDQWNEALALHALGDVALAQGDYARAEALNEAGLALFQQLGDTSFIAVATVLHGYIAWAHGDLASAASRCRDALALLHRIDDTFSAAEGLEGLGIILCDLGQRERAARALGAAAGLREAVGHSPRRTRLPFRDRAVAILRATLGAEAFATAFEAGRASPLDQIKAEVEQG
jgi:tetratricopeptide (TPR) repeat protein